MCDLPTLQAAVAEDDTVVPSQAPGGASSPHRRSLSRGSGPWSRRESRPPRLVRAPPDPPQRQGLQALKSALLDPGATLTEPPADAPPVRVTAATHCVLLERSEIKRQTCALPAVPHGLSPCPQVGIDCSQCVQARRRHSCDHGNAGARIAAAGFSPARSRTTLDAVRPPSAARPAAPNGSPDIYGLLLGGLPLTDGAHLNGGLAAAQP